MNTVEAADDSATRVVNARIVQQELLHTDVKELIVTASGFNFLPTNQVASVQAGSLSRGIGDEPMINTKPVDEKYNATIASSTESTDTEDKKSCEKPPRSSIAVLLRKYIKEADERNTKRTTIQMELQKISQSNREAFCSLRTSSSSSSSSSSSTSSTSCCMKGQSIDSKPGSEVWMKCTRQDLADLAEQIDKLSYLLQNRNQSQQMNSSRVSETESESARSCKGDDQLPLHCADSVDATANNSLSDSTNVKILPHIPGKDRRNLKKVYLLPDTTGEKDAIHKTSTSAKELGKDIKQNGKIISEREKLNNQICVSDVALRRKKVMEKETRTWNRKGKKSLNSKPKVLTPFSVQMLRLKYFSPDACAQVQSFVTCNICHRVFDNVSFESHVKKHKIRKTHSCSVCQQKFRLRHELVKHMKNHPEFRPYRCQVCFKSYGTPNRLKQHMLYHSGQRSHMCSICGNTFWHSTHLKRHTMIHTGEAPFKCSECSRWFKTRSEMKKHQAVHSNERPNLCSECGKTFKLAQGLCQHMQKVHKDNNTVCKTNTHLTVTAQSEPTHEAYQYQTTHILQPNKMDNTALSNMYDYGLNTHQELSKMEDPIQSSFLDQTFLRFPDMSNRGPNFFMPATDTPVSFPSFHNPQVMNRDPNIIFDKWE